MSFILDALRKSESERRREAAPTLVRAPLATVRHETPRWVWVLIVLLAASLVAMAVILINDRFAADTVAVQNTNRGPDSAATAPVPDTAPTTIPAAEPMQPVADLPQPAAVETEHAGGEAESASTTPPRRISALESIDPNLAGMSVNMIAYDENDSANRFVWVSGRRYFTGERIGDRAEIVEIRADSVILAAGAEHFHLEP